MSRSPKKRRARRRKLRAHDRGEDRHNKGVQVIKKQQRAEVERSRQPSRKRTDGAA